MKRIFWAGDSTVQFNGIETYPQTGIGQVMPLYLKKDVVVRNYAKNGRSTRSFINQKRLVEIEEAIEAGDYLFIQFGHNDEKESDPERYTRPDDDFKGNLRIFIETARKAGAKPVLITPLTRRTFAGPHKLDAGNHKEYVRAMKEIAFEENVPLVDLYTMSREGVEKAGEDVTYHWYMHVPAGVYPYKPDGLDTDNTHLQYAGAVIFAGMIAAGLKNLGGEYADLIKEEWDGKIRLYYPGESEYSTP